MYFHPSWKLHSHWRSIYVTCLIYMCDLAHSYLWYGHRKPLFFPVGKMQCFFRRRELWDYYQRSGERQEQRTKTPYSLHIHLISTQLSISAERHVVTRFTCLFSGIGRATSSCAAQRRAWDLSWLYWYFVQLLVFQTGLCNMHRFADLSFQSGPSRAVCVLLCFIKPMGNRYGPGVIP